MDQILIKIFGQSKSSNILGYGCKCISIDVSLAICEYVRMRVPYEVRTCYYINDYIYAFARVCV